MAWSKTGVSMERVYRKFKRTEQAASTSNTHGRRKPQTTSYRKEKHQATKKEVAHAGDPRGDAVQDEASQVHERDLHICDDESEGATSESSKSREKCPTDEENRSITAEWPIPKSISGATGGNVEEMEDDPSAHLPGGPIDRSLLMLGHVP
ncbi:hypothetical protein Scep_017394 [Stephania cephalantha]|uniref:Uncharacterized protein n=1 Tax=Stephania cephalantha TaxID=152367 RepID=A0AAP0IPF9_9MAGN